MRADDLLAHARDRPDELHDEVGLRLLVDLGGRADLLDAALVDDDDLVGDLHRLLLVVRHDDRGHVDLLVQAPQPVAQLLAHARVESAERLVEQQHLRLDRQRAGERHPLALAAGQLRRVAVRPAGQVHQREQLVDALLDLGLRRLADLQPEADVVAHAHVLERGVVLEDEADAAVLRLQAGHLAAVEQHGRRRPAPRGRR